VQLSHPLRDTASSMILRVCTCRCIRSFICISALYHRALGEGGAFPSFCSGSLLRGILPVAEADVCMYVCMHIPRNIPVCSRTPKSGSLCGCGLQQRSRVWVSCACICMCMGILLPVAYRAPAFDNAQQQADTDHTTTCIVRYVCATADCKLQNDDGRMASGGGWVMG